MPSPRQLIFAITIAVTASPLVGVRSVTRFEGSRLVVEEDFGGPKVTTTYERITSDGESRLQVTLQIDGTPEGPGDRGNPSAKVPITRIYDSTK